MHFSAKRGIGIACLSLCLSVTLVDCDHIGWNSSEIISPLVSLECSLSADPNIRGLLQRNIRKLLPKVTHTMLTWASETFDRKLRPKGYRLQIAQRSQWRAYRKSLSLFRMVPSLTPYDLPFPKMGVPYAPRYANDYISATGDPIHFVWF